MTRVRKFKPENRLAKALQDPNGLLFTQALQRAGANLEKVRDRHVAMLDVKVTQIAAIKGSQPGDAAEIYRIAREIRADAALFGLKELSRAAHSLCELMASDRKADQMSQGVVVHVHAIVALQRGGKGGSAASRETLLAGLERISRNPAPASVDKAVRDA